MTTQYATVINSNSRRTVAVLVHDTEIGRAVLKCRDTDWPLQRTFDHWVDRTLTVQETRDVSGISLTTRRKVVRFDKDYIAHLLDKMVRRPYEVGKVVESKSTARLDNLADQLAKKEIDA